MRKGRVLVLLGAVFIVANTVGYILFGPTIGVVIAGVCVAGTLYYILKM